MSIFLELSLQIGQGILIFPQTECGLAEPSIAQVFELLDSSDGVVLTPEKFLHLFNRARKAWQHTRRGAQGINLRSGKHPFAKSYSVLLWSFLSNRSAIRDMISKLCAKYAAPCSDLRVSAVASQSPKSRQPAAARMCCKPLALSQAIIFSNAG